MRTTDADVILHKGRIYPMKNGMDRVPAIAWADGRIMAVGSDEDVLRLGSARTEMINLRGAAVYPGFTDAHAHLEGLGRLLDQVNLIGIPSYGGLVERIGAQADQTPPGAWVTGRGWDSQIWPGHELPTHPRLTARTPTHPVWLKRRDGHSGIANAKALEIAGITPETHDPAGGQIIRDGSGKPTGLLTETAMQLVEGRIPKPTIADLQRWFILAQAECNRQGLTAVHDAGITADALTTLKVLVREELLSLRVYGFFHDPDPDGVARFAQRNSPFVAMGREGLLTMRAIKLYMDGSLGSRTAWMLKDYPGRKGYSGVNCLTKDRLLEIAQEAILRGYQVCTHAIGDRANREVLNVYELILHELVEGDHRLRIEHAQFLDPADIERFGSLGIIASVQPSHAVADMGMVEDRLGPGGHAGGYPWRRLIDANAHTPVGSDFPVERTSPLWNFYCAITRQDESGRPQGGWTPHMCMTRLEAMRGMTTEAAYAAFQEEELGTLEPGKLADLTILSDDILQTTPRNILQTEVLATIVRGKFRYRSLTSDP